MLYLPSTRLLVSNPHQSSEETQIIQYCSLLSLTFVYNCSMVQLCSQKTIHLFTIWFLNTQNKSPFSYSLASQSCPPPQISTLVALNWIKVHKINHWIPSGSLSLPNPNFITVIILYPNIILIFVVFHFCDTCRCRILIYLYSIVVY